MSYPMPKEIDFDDSPNIYRSFQGSSSNHDILFKDLINKIIKDRKGMVEGQEGMKTIKAIETIYSGK
jgi:hypothetical protein